MTDKWRYFARLAAATLLAPIFAAALTATLLALLIFPDAIFQTEVTSAEYRRATLVEVISNLGGTSFIGSLFGVVLGWPAMIIGGLPIHRILLGRGMTGGGVYMLTGLLIGTLVMLAYFILANGWRDPVAVFESGPLLLSGPITGALSAFVFWLIRRPDQINMP